MKYLFLIGILFFSVAGYSQSNVNELFAAGINDAEKFSDSYFGPVSEGAIYSLSNGWYNSADSKPLGGFEISIIGNMTSFKNKEGKNLNCQPDWLRKT